MNLSQIVGACIAVIVAGMPAVLALLKISQLHVLVNSRLTELLRVSAATARAEGQLEGQAGTSDLRDTLNTLNARVDVLLEERNGLLVQITDMREHQIAVFERLEQARCNPGDKPRQSEAPDAPG